jgi:hypothetical protein
MPFMAHAETVEVMDVFDDWSAMQHTDGATALCFATSKPIDITPKTAGSAEAFAYIAYYPAENGTFEISFKLSYIAKKGVALAVAIGSDVFKFVARDDRAFMDNPQALSKLIAAMKKGEKLAIKGTPAKGAETLELYSLNGLSGAMDRAKAGCAAG